MKSNKYAYLLLHHVLGHEGDVVVGVYSSLDKAIDGIDLFPPKYGRWEKSRYWDDKRVGVYVARFETIAIEKHLLG